jgi:predicted Zn-dependent protease
LLATQIERRSGDFKAAEEHLKVYKQLRGATDEFQTEWIILRAQAGESPKLEAALWDCVKKNHPQSIEILETLAGCFLRESRNYAALDCLNEWLKRAPDNLQALEWRALVWENLRAGDEAAADYRAVLKRAPERWQTRLQLAQVLMELTRFEEAARELEVLRTTRGDDDAVRLAWGQCLFGLGEADDARAVLSSLVGSQAHGGTAGQPALFYFLGKLEPDPAKAQHWFRKALELQPTHLEARHALYTRLLQVGRKKEAAEELRAYRAAEKDHQEVRNLHDLMERSPNNPDLLTRLAALLLEKFASPHGEHLLNRALALDPNHPRARELLARQQAKNNPPAHTTNGRKSTGP